jgi:predicted adenine nucleotide alpha hydrolase (AANH) superfamily ATPase
MELRSLIELHPQKDLRSRNEVVSETLRKACMQGLEARYRMARWEELVKRNEASVCDGVARRKDCCSTPVSHPKTFALVLPAIELAVA